MQKRVGTITITSYLSIAFIAFGTFSGCVASMTDEEALSDDQSLAHPDERPGLLPFHVAHFEHHPSAEEIEAELGDFIAKQPHTSILNPVNPALPVSGQKRVTVIATTKDAPNAGTDDANRVSLFAHWRANGSDYFERLVLDNPNQNDLNRGGTSVFHYFIALSSYVPGATSDQFVRAQISNTSKDAWNCSRIEVNDVNRFGTARIQQLLFNQVIEWPGHPESQFFPATNTSTLAY